MTLSPELSRSVTTSFVMQRFIGSQIPEEVSLDTDEKQLVGALSSLTLDLHGSILTLIKAGGQFDGGAFALTRPLIEVAYRAHWIYSCARPEIVIRIREGDAKCYPGLANMAEGIEKKMNADGMFTLLRPYIDALHGYTHGGLEQISRRFDASGNIVATYSDTENNEVISATTAHLTALAMAWCQITSGATQVDEPRSKAISEKYVGLYRTV